MQTQCNKPLQMIFHFLFCLGEKEHKKGTKSWVKQKGLGSSGNVHNPKGNPKDFLMKVQNIKIKTTLTLVYKIFLWRISNGQAYVYVVRAYKVLTCTIYIDLNFFCWSMWQKTTTRELTWNGTNIEFKFRFCWHYMNTQVEKKCDSIIKSFFLFFPRFPQIINQDFF